MARIATVVEHYSAQAGAPAGRAASPSSVGSARQRRIAYTAVPTIIAAITGDVSRLTTSLLVGAMQGLDPALVRAVAGSRD